METTQERAGVGPGAAESIRGGCEGCGDRESTVTEGYVTVRGQDWSGPFKVHYCEWCWEAVDGADPETGAYGATSVAVRRVTA